MRKILYSLGYPLAQVYWYVVRPKTVGVRCIVVNDGKVLLIKNTYNNKGWDFPGGGVDSGEDLSVAAKREVWEETGVKLSEVTKIGDFESDIEFKKDHVNCFVGRTDNFELNIDPGEIAEAKWFEIENLPPLYDLAEKTLKFWDRKV
jgi:8-oxo-dGTP pyrophosphatase MutT (NUDIX family)